MLLCCLCVDLATAGHSSAARARGGTPGLTQGAQALLERTKAGVKPQRQQPTQSYAYVAPIPMSPPGVSVCARACVCASVCGCGGEGAFFFFLRFTQSRCFLLPGTAGALQGFVDTPEYKVASTPMRATPTPTPQPQSQSQTQAQRWRPGYDPDLAAALMAPPKEMLTLTQPKSMDPFDAIYGSCV